MTKFSTRNAKKKINHAFSYEGHRQFKIVGKTKQSPYGTLKKEGFFSKLKFWDKPIIAPPTISDFIIKAGPIKSNEVPIAELLDGTGSSRLSPDMRKVIEKTWVPEPGLTVFDTQQGKALTAEVALKMHIDDKRWTPQYFQNPMQGYDYLVYESLLKNTILGPLAWSLVKFIMGTGFSPALELRNPTGDQEKDSKLIEQHRYIIDNLKYIDRCISEKSDDDGIDISLTSKFSNLIHNMLTFNRSCAVYQFDEKNPIKLNPLGNISKGEMKVYPNIATGLVDFHPRDLGIVKISSKSKKMESVQIAQISGMVKVKQMIYLWNSQNAAAIYNAKYYGGSILMPMIEPARLIRTHVSSVLPTVAENMAGGLYHIFVEPEGGTEAQRQLEYQTITEATEFGTANVFMLAPDRVKYENVNFDPKVNDLITSFDTMVKYVIACFNLPQIGSYDEAAANHATAEEKMQYTISTAINPLREWIGDDFSKQWYQRNFMEIYAKDYPKLVELFRIKVEFEDLQIETLKDRAETLSALKNAGIQLDEEKIEEIIQIEGLKDHMEIIEDNPGDDFQVNDKGNDNFNVKSKPKAPKKNDKNLKARVLAAEQVLEEDGEWITSNGQHILIPNGRDKGEVLKEHFEKLKNKSEPKSKSKSKTTTPEPTSKREFPVGDKSRLKIIGESTEKILNDPLTYEEFTDEFLEKYMYPGYDAEGFSKGKDPILNKVFGKGPLTIGSNELEKYEQVLKEGIASNDTMKEFQKRVRTGNQTIKDQLAKSKTVYRGMGLDELKTIADNGGKVGKHERENYTEGGDVDFTSTSVDKDSAEIFARNHFPSVIVEFDVNEMRETSVSPVEYQLRRDVRIDDGDEGNSKRPYEKFGGSHSSRFQHEAEVHLKNNTTPIIREIFVESLSPEIKGDLDTVLERLEKVQGNKIKVNYDDSLTDSMSGSKDNKLEKAIKELQKIHPNMSRQSLISELQRWS